MKRAVLTLSLGDRQDIFTYPKISMTNYAQRYNYELIVVDRNEKFKKPSQDIRSLKLSIIEYYLDYYDRIIFFDDTCLIHPYTMDLFELVPHEKLGAYIESKDFRRASDIEHCVDHFSKLENVELEYKPNMIMVNSGVLVLSKIHQPLFRLNNHTIDRLQTDVYDLGLKYNYVGSRIRANWGQIDDKIDENRIFHMTRGSGDTTKRAFFLEQLYYKLSFL